MTCNTTLNLQWVFLSKYLLNSQIHKIPKGLQWESQNTLFIISFQQQHFNSSLALNNSIFLTIHLKQTLMYEALNHQQTRQNLTVTRRPHAASLAAVSSELQMQIRRLADTGTNNPAVDIVYYRVTSYFPFVKSVKLSILISTGEQKQQKRGLIEKTFQDPFAGEFV